MLSKKEIEINSEVDDIRKSIRLDDDETTSKSDSTVDPGIAKYPTGTALDLDAGLSHNVAAQVETPKTFLERVLVDDEEVIDTFDVKFPGEFVPLWKIVALLIVTLGFYSIILLFRAIRRWCYRMRCCTPSTVHFTFGKMAITSKGRVICWKEEVYQFKPPQKSYKGTILLCYLDWCVSLIFWVFAKLCIVMCCPDLCAPPIEYNTTNSFRSYRIDNVKQITQFMTNEALCIWCCLDYQAGVEISFQQFNHGSNHLQIASRSWVSEDHFGEEAQAVANSTKNASYFNWARAVYGVAKNVVGNIESAAGIAPNLDTIFVYTNTGDRVHNGDVDSMLKDVNALHKRILNLLPTLKDAIVAEEIDFSKLKITKPGDHFGGTISLGKMEGNAYKKTDTFKNCTIVGNKGEIQIPDSWMPLLSDEVVIATNGQVPRMNCFEWFWSIISFGYYYCKLYRRRKYTRSALVLTNKRLMSVDIYERSGTVPLTLSNFSIQVRSYVLGTVKSGFIYSKSNNHLECGIETDGGALFLNFTGTGRLALPFAQSLQMAVKRKSNAIKSDMSKVGGQFKAEDFPSVKFHLVPYLTGEYNVNVIKGNHSWEPFGQGIWAKCCECCRRTNNCSIMNTIMFLGMNGTDGCCWNDKVNNACSYETCNDECCCVGQRETPCFFPCIPYILTCALRPFQYETTLIVTNMSIIRLATYGNYGLCGCLRFLGLLKEGPCVTNDSIMISWSTLDSFSGFNLDIKSEGKENVTRRCCRSNCIGKICCPIGAASAELAIDFNGQYSFKTYKEEPNKIWIKDEGLNSTVKTLTRLQFILQEKIVDDAKRNYKSEYLPESVPPQISAAINRV